MLCTTKKEINEGLLAVWTDKYGSTRNVIINFVAWKEVLDYAS